MSNYKKREFEEVWYCEDGEFTVYSVDGSSDEYAVTFNDCMDDNELIEYLKADLESNKDCESDCRDIEKAIWYIKHGYLVEYDED